MENNIHYIECRGKELQPYLEELAKLRITIFRDWPYLYEGSMDYEHKYLQTYLKSDNSFITLALDGSKIVGATTAILVSDEEEAFRKVFSDKGINPKTVCYFGESILYAEYRGLGIGKEFMKRRLAFARSIPGVSMASFCSVIRPINHPKKPAYYQPLDVFWKSMGFQPISGMLTKYSWQDLGESTQSEKTMHFWVNKLEEKMTNQEQAKQLIENYYQSFNNGDWDRFFTMLSKSVIHDLNQGERQIGIPKFREFINEMNRCYKEKVVNLVLMTNSDGSRVAAEFIIEGVYHHSQTGLPEAHGQKYRLPVGAFFEIQNQLVTRITNYYNLNDWIQQVEG